MLLPAPPTPVVFAPDFVTVGQIAGRFCEGGVALQAAEDCRDDVYVLASDGLTLEGLRAALLADGRLELDGETLRRSRATDPRGAYLRYEAAVRRDAVRVYARTLEWTMAIRSADLEQRERYLKMYRSGRETDPFIVESNRLIRLINVDNDIHVTQVALPMFILERDAPPLGRRRASRGTEAATMLGGGDPRGTMEYLRLGARDEAPEILERKAAGLWVEARVAWDPFSATMGAYTEFGHKATPDFYFNMNAPVARTGTGPRVALRDVLPKEEWPAYEARVAGTAPTLAGLADAKPATAAVSARVSEALLAWARFRKGRELLAYVSPITDLRSLGPSGPAVLGRVNAANFWEGGMGDYLRTFSRNAKETREAYLSLPAKFTASRTGGMLVVRNELAFLDVGAPAAAVPSPAFLSARAAGRAVPLEEAARAACAMRFGLGDAGGSSVHWADMGDPLAFRPFARALLDAPALVTRIAAMGAGPLTIPGSELPLSSVRQGMRDVAPHVRTSRSLPRAWNALAAFQALGREAELVVERKGEGRITFRLGPADRPLWTCELNHIEGGRPLR